ncbi:hypothetical protein ACQEU6_26990 [Spirillospora sp. CA-108201]
MISNYDGPSQQDVDRVMSEGGTLTFDLAGAYGAAEKLARACELLSGRIDLPITEILAAGEFAVHAELRLSAKATGAPDHTGSSQPDDTDSSQEDVDRVMSEGGTLTFRLADDASELYPAVHELSRACETVSGRIDLPDVEILDAMDDFDVFVEVRLSLMSD